MAGIFSVTRSLAAFFVCRVPDFSAMDVECVTRQWPGYRLREMQEFGIIYKNERTVGETQARAFCAPATRQGRIGGKTVMDVPLQ
ncbi:MAG: hypothetical protein LBS65_02110 [Desulfovibrio sp.]|nr:hypothetical protein [Desulfovibrio sp.]